MDTEQKVVALTFDDGPSDKGPSIEQALADLKTPATSCSGRRTARKLYQLTHYLAEHNRKTITWDVEPDSDSSDPAPDDPKAIVRTTLDQVRPGSIILLHPWNADHDVHPAVLPGIVDGLRAKGYRFVTVNELLNTH